jgi:hypothetical protein
MKRSNPASCGFTPFFIKTEMKKRRIVALAAVVMVAGVLVSLVITNYTPSDKIKFGYLECMKLDSGEYSVKPIDSISIHEFLKYYQYDSSEIYLNRVIQGNNKIFIALSARLAPQEYIALMNKDSLISVYFSRQYSFNQKLYYANFMREKEKFIYRTLYAEPKHGDMLLIDFINKDSLSILKLYNDKNFLNKKLNCD